MAYDEELAERAMAEVDDLADISTRKMFGGFAIMWQGNMLVGVIGDDLMVRVGRAKDEEFLAEIGVREMDFAGTPMRGMLLVEAATLADQTDLERWVQRARDFVGSLPPK